jgi:ribosome maturation factor RimP
VELSVKGKPNNMKVQVFIDGDNLVDIEECSRISRKLSNEMEERALIDGKYTVEVSSPGVDKPLMFIRQYPKHVDRELEVLTVDNKKFQGTLLSVVDNEIELSIKSSKIKKELNSESLKLAFDEIEKATVVLRF